MENKEQKRFRQYRGVLKNLHNYWKLYGGFSALVTSPFLHISIVLSAIAFKAWSGEPETAWYDLIISVLPNVLGFTLGGYAILLAFGDSLLEALMGMDKDGNPSPFMTLNSSIVHFMIVQVVSLLFAIVAKPFQVNTGVIAAFGFTCFLYAILTTLAAIMALFQFVGWLDSAYSDTNSDNDQ